MDVIKRLITRKLVVIMDAKIEMRKSLGAYIYQFRAAINADAVCRLNRIQKIGRKTTNLQHAFAGRNDKTQQPKYLVVVIAIVADVFRAFGAQTIVMVANFISASLQCGGPKASGSHRFGNGAML